MTESKEIKPIIITSQDSEQFTKIAANIAEILKPIGFSENSTNSLAECIGSIYNTEVAKALVIDISVREGGLLSPALRFETVLKEKQDFTNRIHSEKIEEIAHSHSKFSQLISNESDSLQTFLHIYDPSVDPLSDPPEISETSDKLQRIGISTKRNLTYLLFE